MLGENEFILADDWAYLERKGLIEKIYLSDFVDHPVDLSDSNIQKERENASLSIRKNTMNLRKKIEISIKIKLRIVALNIYKYVEKRDI